MSGIKKNIVFIVMILIVLVVGLVWYSSYNEPSVAVDDESPADAIRDVERDSEYEAVRIQILANIATIEAIRLDTTILQDPAFLVLERPERQAAGPLNPGRPNPFLPY